MLSRLWSAALASLLPVFLLMPTATQAASLDLAPYKGKVVYLDFWASWCAPCRQSFPWMNQLQQAYGPKGFVVIAVNVDHERDLADEFLRQTQPNFKIVYDASGEIASTYRFKDMPTSVLIGRDGKVRFVHQGFFPEKEDLYASHISALINERAL